MPDSTPAPLLVVHGLEVAYGAICAVKGIAFQVQTGELVCLIGSNGAGKSTTLKTLAGLITPKAGQIVWRGQPIQGLGAWDLVPKGLVLVPEGRGILMRMSVEENLIMGAYTRPEPQALSAGLERAYSLFPKLAERARQLAGTLSGGEQQMLAMARALMAQPKLLLLDEPSMGLSPQLVDKIFEIIQSLIGLGVTVLLVEQNASRALAVADRAYVMESGLITLAGSAADLLVHPGVRAAYMGG
jgi:branched-chain amino acid transport system ATP-binding protein